MKKSLKHALPKYGTQIVTLIGISMRPFLREGDVLRIDSVDSQNVMVGDLILYSDHGIVVCHRVFRKRGNAFETKADAELRPDALIRPEQILGRVAAIHTRNRTIRFDNYGGRLLNFLVGWISILTALLYMVIGKCKHAQRTFNKT